MEFESGRYPSFVGFAPKRTIPETCGIVLPGCLIVRRFVVPLADVILPMKTERKCQIFGGGPPGFFNVCERVGLT